MSLPLTVLLVLALAVVAAGAVAWLRRSPTVTLRIPQDVLQRRVDAEMPVSGSQLGVSYAIPYVRLHLRADGRVGFTADATAEAFGQRLELALAGSGTVTYRNSSFFLGNLAVDAAVPRLGEAAMPRAAEPEAAGSWLGGVARLAATAALGEGIGRIGGARDGIVASARDSAVAALEAFLARTPVYELRQDDRWEAVARRGLTGMRVEEGVLVADFDVARTIRVQARA